jgi:hypothetical protein
VKLLGHAPKLPPHWGTIYELSKPTDEQRPMAVNRSRPEESSIVRIRTCASANTAQELPMGKKPSPSIESQAAIIQYRCRRQGAGTQIVVNPTAGFFILEVERILPCQTAVGAFRPRRRTAELTPVSAARSPLAAPRSAIYSPRAPVIDFNRHAVQQRPSAQDIRRCAQGAATTHPIHKATKSNQT